MRKSTLIIRCDACAAHDLRIYRAVMTGNQRAELVHRRLLEKHQRKERDVLSGCLSELRR